MHMKLGQCLIAIRFVLVFLLTRLLHFLSEIDVTLIRCARKQLCRTLTGSKVAHYF